MSILQVFEFERGVPDAELFGEARLSLAALIPSPDAPSMPSRHGNPAPRRSLASATDERGGRHGPRRRP